MKRNKLLVAVLALSLIFSVFMFTSCDGWKKEEADIDFSGGSGFASDPYQIKDGDDLAELRDHVNNNDGEYASAYYKMINNIDLGSISWTPIGNNSSPFKGVFNGDGFSVSNFELSENEFSGLFGFLTGTISNCRVRACLLDVTNSRYVGGLCGYSLGLIDNCFATVTIQSTLNGSAGGLCGVNSGTIYNSYSTGEINAQGGIFAIIGGLCGMNTLTPYDSKNYTGQIINCFSTVDINTELTVVCGGLCGENITSISASYSTGDITALNQTTPDYTAIVGGLCGITVGTVVDCYSTCDIDMQNSGIGYIGGIAGQANGIIDNTFATGNIKSSYLAGGICATICDETGTLVISDSFSSGNLFSSLSEYANTNVGTSYSYCDRVIYYKDCYDDETYTNITVTNCFYYEDATIKSEPEGYVGYDCTIYYAPVTSCGDSELNSSAFYTDTLGFTASVWNYDNLDFVCNVFPSIID